PRYRHGTAGVAGNDGLPGDLSVVAIREREVERSPRQVLKLRRIEVRREASAESDFLKGLEHRRVAADRPGRGDPHGADLMRINVPIREHPIAGKDLDAEALSVLRGVEPAARHAGTDRERRRNQTGPECGDR